MTVPECGLRVDSPSPEVRVLRLSRPERLNALSWELVDALAEAFEQLARDADCRVAVLTGEGRGFCSGLDLQMSDDPIGSLDSMVAFMDRQERLASLVTTLRALPIPVIAAVNGPAAGGGFALALACDLRVCAESARFNAAFVRIGLSACDMGVSYALPRLVGVGAASDLMLTGRQVGAREAMELGMVNRVVPDEDLLDAALALAGEIARNSPFAVRMTKEVLAANVDSPSLASALALENRTQAVASRTADQAEALRAFVEKREARFQGV
ncbi:MAG: enoyl-CoA hydratase [Solirubrobacteraceae bacterium]|nr:enoyl-CoA hydratase [Solirubrobacteraceae bacterium]